MPKVSFVVPCYKLAHLLPECIASILTQTVGDWEVLVMDDCSPDDVRGGVQRIADRRVVHVRNERNLGHLANYNKGIELARGEYVWLISPDDYLRSNHVVENYVNLLDKDPRIGFAFCAGVGVRGGVEMGVLPYSRYAKRDQVVSGHTFLKTLLRENVVLAASGLVRKECYDRFGGFPPDMPFAGDWYMWSLFALHYDVAYFAEPMVAYRQHEGSMTVSLTTERAEACCEEDVAVLWAIKQVAEKEGFESVVGDCISALGYVYGRNLAIERYGMLKPALSMERFEISLCAKLENEADRDRVRAVAYAEMGNLFYWKGQMREADQMFRMALRKHPMMLKIWVKWALLRCGGLGDLVRRRIRVATSSAM